jgi:hypothetical protein
LADIADHLSQHRSTSALALTVAGGPVIAITPAGESAAATPNGFAEPQSFALALSMARSIIQDHGGVLELTERQHAGMGARIVLPAKPAAMPDERDRLGQAAAPRGAYALPSLPGSDCKIG